MGGFMEVFVIYSIVILEKILRLELLIYLIGIYLFRLGKGTVICCVGCCIEFVNNCGIYCNL